MRWWKWWLDKKNREGAEALVGFVKLAGGVAAAGVIAVAGWWGFSTPKPMQPPDPEPPNVQTGDHSPVNIGDGTQILAGGDLTIGLSEETFLAMLDKRSAELRADLERAGAAEKRVLQQQLDAVIRQKADLDSAYQAALRDLGDLRTRLAEFEGDVPRDKLEAAQKALSQGNRNLADSLLAELEDKSQAAVALVAEAAFARGEIAAQEIRWREAADHFTRAARLDPTFERLLAARQYAWHTGDYTAALRWSDDLVALATAEGDQQRLAAALNERAITLKAVGDYANAEPLFRQALAITRTVPGEDHPHYAHALNNLALLLAETGRPAEAEPLYRQALAITRTALGEDHPAYATALNNLAGLLADTARNAEAETLHRQALKIRRSSLGADHPDFATDLNNLALLLAETGRQAEAEPLYRQALAIDRKALGEDHPDYAAGLNNLALLLAQTGRQAEAEPLYRQALGIDRNALGEDHPAYARCLNNLARLLEETDRTAEAEPLYRQALTIHRKALGDTHPGTRKIAGHLVRLLTILRPDDPDLPAFRALAAEPSDQSLTLP